MNNLNKINTTGKTSNRLNPIISKPEKETVSKTMRIYETDFKLIREMAFKEEKAMVEVVKEAIELLYNSKNYDK